MRLLRWWIALVTLVSGIVGGLLIQAASGRGPGDDLDEEDDFDGAVEGPQEIRYYRSVLARGGIPQPSTITPEGVLDWHALPIVSNAGCTSTVCLGGVVAETDLLTRPDLDFLAGFSLSNALKPEGWSRPPLNVVLVVDASGAASGEQQKLVRDSVRLILNELGKGDQISIVVRGTQARVHLHPYRIGFLNRGPVKRAAKTLALTTGGADDAIRAGFDLARSTRAAFSGETRVVIFTDHEPDLHAAGENDFGALLEAPAFSDIGLTVIGLGVKFTSDLSARVAFRRGSTVRSYSNTEDLDFALKNSFDGLFTTLAHDIDITITPREGLRVEGVYGLPRYLVTWDATGRGLRFRAGALFVTRAPKTFFVTLASERGDLARGEDGEGGSDEPVVTARFAYQPVLQGDEGGAVRSIDVPQVALVAHPGMKRAQVLLSEYLSLKTAAREHLLDGNTGHAKLLTQDLASMLANDVDPLLDPERSLVQRFTEALAVSEGRSAAAVDEEAGSRSRSKSRAPQQALWGAWFAESSTDEARVGDTYCFFPGGSLLLFPGLDEEDDSTGRPMQVRSYSLWAGILRVDERQESWDWSVADDQLFLEGRGSLRGLDITLKRVPMPAAAEGRSGGRG